MTERKTRPVTWTLIKRAAFNGETEAIVIELMKWYKSPLQAIESGFDNYNRIESFAKIRGIGAPDLVATWLLMTFKEFGLPTTKEPSNVVPIIAARRNKC